MLHRCTYFALNLVAMSGFDYAIGIPKPGVWLYEKRQAWNLPYESTIVSLLTPRLGYLFVLLFDLWRSSS